mmetsp:Transcript_2591/g.3694  ORF Transcript_2591/g.3694 Transcript_2591/m.3694 type:complete len:1759 (-) Transcript_2591:300-5576(-)
MKLEKKIHPSGDDGSQDDSETSFQGNTNDIDAPAIVPLIKGASPDEILRSRLVKKSLGVFSETDKIRIFCVRIVENKYFDHVILVFIILNSIVLALIDYSVVDPDTGLPTADGSWQNSIVENTEIMFTIVFTVELVLKVIALGLLLGRNTYLRYGWNILDAVVVIAGWIEIFLADVGLSALRLFRILRPLKTLSKIGGLKTIIVALLNSLSSLGNVVFLLFFAMSVFGIMGVQFFQGALHARCRLTSFPVKLNLSCTDVYDPCWSLYIETVTQDEESWRCLNVSNNDATWSKKSSPWSERQDCIWPIDNDETNVCSMSGSGLFTCPSGQTCGSNYDDAGNPRFIEDDIPYGFNRMHSGTFIEDLNWGYTRFDHFAYALLAIFQSITMEGWVDICYQCMYAVNGPGAAFIFFLLIMLGSFIMLNMMLGVITQSINDEEEKQEEEERRESQVEGRQEQCSEKSKSVASNGAKKEIDGTAACGAEDEEEQDWPLWREKLLLVVEHPGFNGFIMVVILVNTVTLAMVRYNMSEREDTILENINMVLTIIFAVEMFMAIGGFGLQEYLSHRMNQFDAFIVVTSIIELIIQKTDTASVGGLSALRSFRLFRVLKLAKNWRDLQVLLQTALQTFYEIGNFAILLFLFLYIFALIGMQFFANKMHFDPDSGAKIAYGEEGYDEADIPQLNYDKLWWAFLTVFQILSGENWNSVMYDAWRAAGGAVAIIYFLALIFIGGFIVMNLFLAILLNNFEGNDDLISTGGPGLVSHLKKVASMRSKFVGKGDEPATAFEKLQMQVQRVSVGISLRNVLKTASMKGTEQELAPGKGSSSLNLEAKDKETSGYMSDEETLTEMSELQISMKYKSLWMFSGKNPLRQEALVLIGNKYFDRVIVVLIVISSITLAVDNPLASATSFNQRALTVIDIIFAIIFTLEAAIKVFALGFLLHRGSYLRNSWNILDFIIVIISDLDWLAGAQFQGSYLKTLRIIRVLRPLRMISRQPELKRVVNVMIKSFGTMAKVLIIVLLFFLIYGIIGVNYLQGTFFACQGDTFDALPDEQYDFMVTPTSWSEMSNEQKWWFNGTSCEDFNNTQDYVLTGKDVCVCLCGEGSWDHVLPLHFDNVFYAMAVLYEISTTEGWSDYMFAAIEQCGENCQPNGNHQPAWMLFFIIFVMLGSFFVMNLFVGIIIDFFNRERKASHQANLFMTAEQEQWAKTQKLIQKIRPRRQYPVPKEFYRKFFFTIMNNPNFDNFTMGCILANSFVMAMQYFGQPDAYGLALEIINIIFALYFTLEAVIKLIAVKSRYFKDGWNIFDFIIVLGTDIGLLLWVSTGVNVGSVASVVRIFRLGRIFRLINSLKSLKKMFDALVTSLPSFVNIGGLLFILYFIYAVCGVQLFAKIASNDDYNRVANFRSFPYAMLTLFRFSTGENWNGFMHSMMLYPDGCEADPEYNENWCEITKYKDGCTPINGCGSGTAVPFFYSFTLIITFTMMNLFIGVILESIEEDDDTGEQVLSQEHLEIFAEDWAKFDPDVTYMMPKKLFPQFLQILDEPMGFGEDYNATSEELETLIYNLGISTSLLPDGEEVYRYESVAVALAKRVVIKKQGAKFQELPLDHSLNKNWKHKGSLQDKTNALVNAQFLISISAKALQAKKAVAQRNGDDELKEVDGGRRGDSSPEATSTCENSNRIAPSKTPVSKSTGVIKVQDPIIQIEKLLLKETQIQSCRNEDDVSDSIVIDADQVVNEENSSRTPKCSGMNSAVKTDSWTAS